jgi:hypothetical protein
MQAPKKEMKRNAINFLELTLGIILPLTLQNPKLSCKKEIVFYTSNGLLILCMQTGIPCCLEQLISNLMVDK